MISSRKTVISSRKTVISSKKTVISSRKTVISSRKTVISSWKSVIRTINRSPLRLPKVVLLESVIWPDYTKWGLLIG